MLRGHDFPRQEAAELGGDDPQLPSISTPGHAPGSMCVLVEGSPMLFSGDTLFPGGPGKTTTRAAFATIVDSIERRLFATLDDDTVVMPGHGEDTTIGAERPHLQEWVERGW